MRFLVPLIIAALFFPVLREAVREHKAETAGVCYAPQR